MTSGTPSRVEEKARRKSRRMKTVAIGAGLGVGVATVSAIGFAAWTVTGAGTTSDKALTAAAVTLTASATPTADLYPGASGAAQFTVTNPNPYAVTINTLTFGTVTSSDPTNCPATNITTTAKTGLSIAVPANGTSAPQSVASSFTMATTAPNGCQGVTFTVAATATGVQS